MICPACEGRRELAGVPCSTCNGSGQVSARVKRHADGGHVDPPPPPLRRDDKPPRVTRKG